jgi:hypothetical protein
MGRRIGFEVVEPNGRSDETDAERAHLPGILEGKGFALIWNLAALFHWSGRIFLS